MNVAEPNFFKRLDELIAQTPLDDWRPTSGTTPSSDAAPWLSSAVRPGNFDFSIAVQRREVAAAAMETLPARDRRPDRRSARPGVRREDLFAGGARARQGGDRRHPRVVRRSRAEARLDVRRDEEAGARQAGEDAREGRLSRQVARLFEARDQPTVRSSLNVWRANAFEWKRTVESARRRPSTLTEWGMTVPTVNAYYNGTKNEMVFPAGALAPQTFDPNADDAGNYGSLGGSWAGHELTHGFDDEGRHYDAKGNLRDWWLAVGLGALLEGSEQGRANSSTHSSRSTPCT